MARGVVVQLVDNKEATTNRSRRWGSLYPDRDTNGHVGLSGERAQPTKEFAKILLIISLLAYFEIAFIWLDFRVVLFFLKTKCNVVKSIMERKLGRVILL